MRLNEIKTLSDVENRCENLDKLDKNVILKMLKNGQIHALRFCDLLQNVDGEFVKEIENAIWSSKNYEYAYNFAKLIPSANVKKMQEIIVEGCSNNVEGGKYLIDFAKNVKGADISLLEDVVIKSKTSQYVFLFAKEVLGADTEKLQKAFIEIGDIQYAGYFLRSVKGADRDKLTKLVLSKADEKELLDFANVIKRKGLEDLEKEVLTKNNANLCLEWLTKFGTKRFEEHFKVIVDYGDFKDCEHLYSSIYIKKEINNVAKFTPLQQELFVFAIEALARNDYEKGKARRLKETLKFREK